jgi:hypothetical protein
VTITSERNNKIKIKIKIKIKNSGMPTGMGTGTRLNKPIKIGEKSGVSHIL